MHTWSIDVARDDIENVHQGDSVFFTDPEGRVRNGTVRIKEIRCGKCNCKKCPHKKYAYAQYRVGKKVTEKYIGVAR